MIKSSLKILALSCILGFTSCSLFNTDDLPECLKEARKPGPEISYCVQPVYFTRPAWHPNGEWIAAEHTDSVDTNNDGIKDTRFNGIWLVHAETGETQPLMPFGNSPDWSPDGTYLAVHGGGGIYTVEITSLEPAQFDTTSINLLTDFDAPAFFPTWSGDGEWIAFDTNYENPNGTYGIAKKNIRNGTFKNISTNLSQGAWRQPDWSKNNLGIVFKKYNIETGWNIFTASNNGESSKKLTKNGENHTPKFSPDGQKIVFFHRNKYKSHIVVMKADGSDKKIISNNWSSDPAWSPDGKKIVYLMSNQFHERKGNGQLWIMNANGSNKKQLTNFKPTMP